MFRGIDIQTGDFRELSKQLADNSIDAIVTDPPYPKEYLPLWDDLGRMAARVLKPGGFLATYSAEMFLPQIMAMMGEHLKWYWLATLTHPGGTRRVWNRRILTAAKPILIYTNMVAPKREKWFTDLLRSPALSKRYHAWGQSVPPFVYLVERLTNPGDLVLDPFLGGGTTAVACLQTGRRCVGYEIDAEMAERARERVGCAQLPLAISLPPEQMVLDPMIKEA